MDEEIKQRVVDYLDAIAKAAGDASSFTLEQAPLVAQEYVAFGFWSSLVHAIGLSVAVIVIWLVWHRATQAQCKEDRWMVAVFPGIFSLGFGALIAYNTETLIKTTIAPRVYLLEKVMDLVS